MIFELVCIGHACQIKCESTPVMASASTTLNVTGIYATISYLTLKPPYLII